MDTRRDFIFVDDLVDVVVKAVDGAGPRASTTSRPVRTTRSRSCSTQPSRALSPTLDRRVEVRPRNPDDAFTILLDPSRTARTSAGGRRRRSRKASRRAIEYYRDARHHADVHAPRARAGRASPCVSLPDARPGRRRRRLRRQQPRPRVCSTRGSGAILVVDNLLSAERENIPADPTSPVRRRLDRGRRRARRLQDDFDYVFHLSHVSRQPELDRRPAGRPRAQPADHAQAVRADQGRTGAFRAVVYAARAARWHARRSTRPKPRRRTARPLDMDSPYPDLQDRRRDATPSTTSGRHGLPTVRARFQNVSGPGEILGAGPLARARRRPSGAT